MMQRVRLTWKAYCVPKRGHKSDEYEDAFAGDLQGGRFAVADGASESSFAALWARLLVNKFVQASKGPAGRWGEWLPPLQRRWAREVDGKPLPWYAEEKAALGAFATFLGLALDQDRWHAVAVGDSCLFQVRGERLHEAFPVTRSGDFGNTPPLLGSKLTTAERAEKQQATAGGGWQADDWLLLMTDALAQWFLARTEAGGEPAREVVRLLKDHANSAAFAAWVERLRDHEDLRNDDVTLLAVGFRPNRPPADSPPEPAAAAKGPDDEPRLEGEDVSSPPRLSGTRHED